jgi:uncharacterized membrane protein
MPRSLVLCKDDFDSCKERRRFVFQRFKQDLKNDLIAGLLVVIPLATTIWLTINIATWVVNFLTKIPKQINPFDGLDPLLVNILNFVVGLTVPLLGILTIGLMARNIAGKWLLDVGEQLLQAIPLAGAVYKTLKQLLETLLKDTGNKFRRVVLVEYPRRGMWALAFVTGSLDGEIQSQMSEPMLNLFIPTTPNPTTGWYAVVPEQDVMDLAMSIEDAFKVIVSGGIVNPGNLGSETSRSGLNMSTSSTVSPLSENPVPVVDFNQPPLVREAVLEGNRMQPLHREDK